MKKFTAAIIAAAMLMALTACNGEESSGSEDTVAGTDESALSAEKTSDNTDNNSGSGMPGQNSGEPEDKTSSAEQKSLPAGVEFSIEGNKLSRDDITKVTFGENDIWNTAKFDGFAYMTEPSEIDFKRYNTGDEICGLKVTAAYNVFGNDYLDNENHESFRCTSIADLEGTLMLTGTLTVDKEDELNQLYKKGEIIFTSDREVFPIISGLPDNKYYCVRCGNINDGALPEIAELTAGEEYKVEITVSDIELYSAMPVEACVYCAIDSITLL